MKVIIGTYRGPELVQRALTSLEENATGITKVTIVDDSGVGSWLEEFARMRITPSDHHRYGATVTAIKPEVVSVRRSGYNKAMQAVVREAGNERFLFWEEDFILTAPVDLAWMEEHLARRPYLAQLALLRGPHFPIEHEMGGLLPGLIKRLGADKVQLRLVDGILEQRGTFTCNPSVWQAGIAKQGWPIGKWSEDRMRDRLLRQGYRFGFVPGVRVEHDGVRSGYGY